MRVHLSTETVGNFASRSNLLLILLASGFFIFWGLGSFDLFDPDQGMWGSIAQEMVKGGDWITPHFNGVRYLEKPPLYFWLTALTLSLFGPSEWVIKLWSALPALGTAILTYRMGLLFYGRAAALTSALVMISSAEVLQYARQPVPDFLLVFSITLAIYGFVKSPQFAPSSSGNDQPQTNGRLSLLFYLGIALAVLSKGLIGLVFPILIVGFFLWFCGDRVTWRQYSLAPGLTLFLVLVLPWHLLAAWKNPGFLWFYFVDNQFLRFLNRRAYIEEDVPLTTPAFLANILIWIFPWTVVLPAALREAIPRSRSTATCQHRIRLLVGLWALTVIGFFSLSSSKLEHYFLPAIVPLSLMAGKVWADEFSSPGSSTILKWSFGVAALVFPLLGGGLLFLGFRLTPDGILRALAQVDVYYRILWTHGHGFPYASVSSFVPLLLGVGVVFIIGFPLAFALLHFQLPKASFATLLAVCAVTGLTIFRLVFLLQPFHSAKSTAHVLSARLEPGDRIVYEGDLSYAGGIPFYTGRQVYVLNGRQGDLEFGSYYPEAKHLFLDNASFARLWEGDRQVVLVTRFPAQQSSVKHFPNSKFFFVGRYGSYWLYANRSVGTEEQFNAAR